jgi:hypothetical protein
MDPISRRELLQRSGLLAAAIALGGAAGAQRFIEEAVAAIDDDLKRDTLLALGAFILPGNDRYSVHQGVSADGPGAVDSGAIDELIRSLDLFLPPPLTAVPMSGGTALLLNQYALDVRQTAAVGPFPTPFANLSFQEKGEVFRRFEADNAANEAIPELKFVAGILPTFTAFIYTSEAGRFDPVTRKLTGTPVSWSMSRYTGPHDGHKELRGYYRGLKDFKSDPSRCERVCARRPRPHGRPRCRPPKKRRTTR